MILSNSIFDCLAFIKKDGTEHDTEYNNKISKQNLQVRRLLSPFKESAFRKNDRIFNIFGTMYCKVLENFYIFALSKFYKK